MHGYWVAVSVDYPGWKVLAASAVRLSWARVHSLPRRFTLTTAVRVVKFAVGRCWSLDGPSGERFGPTVVMASRGGGHHPSVRGTGRYASPSPVGIELVRGLETASNDEILNSAYGYEVGICNGDTGVIVEGDGGVLMAAFQCGDNTLDPSSLLPAQAVYAMTIHQRPGSQYDTVSVMLPAEASTLLTRELLYTVITRARTRVRVLGTEESVRAGVERQVLRASGLRRANRPYDG